MNQPWVYVCSPSCVPLLPPSPPHPSGHPSTPVLSTLSHASNLDWRTVSHMVIYMFQRYSLKSSRTRPLPHSPKDCSIHLCLFCCLANRVIVTIFLPGESQGWQSLVCCHLWGHTGSDTTEVTCSSSSSSSSILLLNQYLLNICDMPTMLSSGIYNLCFHEAE